MAYLLDANVFINAKNNYYGFDFCPAFWEWLIVGNADKRVFSIDRVLEEINKGEDELTVWAKEQNNNFFLKPPQNIHSALNRVSDHVENENYYTRAAIDLYYQSADYLLSAHALISGYSVVTHESASKTKNKIKIPIICKSLGVNCTTTFGMLHTEQPRFVLGSA